MEVYEDYQMALQGDSEALSRLGDLLSRMISRVRYKNFSSFKVPNVPDASWISFLYYNRTFAFVIKYKEGPVFIKEIAREEMLDFVFTPALLDLKTLSTVGKEDAYAR